jgi:hypothetical protein
VAKDMERLAVSKQTTHKVHMERFNVKKLNGVEAKEPMLGGSLVTTAWRVLRLRMEEAPSSYGGKLRIY